MAAAAGLALQAVRLTLKTALAILQFLCVVWAMYLAWDIRMYPIRDFGMLIHEFDPWFNYRAAEYMCEHGLAKFYKWFDYMSWYPLGRAIGTTTYPGMQLTACAIRDGMLQIPAFTYSIPLWIRHTFNALATSGLTVPQLPKEFVYEPMSVNDICCMIGPWFGAIASLFTGLLTHEITRSWNACVVATMVMAVIPAHIMRSIGGKFDNEAVAMAAICSTFWLWLRSVRTPKSWPFAILAGLSYIYMVLAWGGYIFVINMVGVHALMLVGLGRFNSGVYRAYTIFFIIGTYGAVQVPVVGWQPLRSLEQMGPLLVFFGYQVLGFCDMVRWQRQSMTVRQFVIFRAGVSAAFLLALVLVCIVLYPTGYFGPLSARIRGLFVKHTKTGNPLVDSVAEHRPASPGIYTSLLGWPLDSAVPAILVCSVKQTTGCWFAALYAAVAFHFSHKMSRLVLICAPICAVGCGIWCGWLIDFMLQPFFLLLGQEGFKGDDVEKDTPKTKSKSKKGAGKPAPESWTARELEEYEEEFRPGGMMMLIGRWNAYSASLAGEDHKKMRRERWVWFDSNPTALLCRCGFSGLIALYLISQRSDIVTWFARCHQYSMGNSNAKVVYWANDRVKGRVKIDDYLKGYQWIEQNTPKDARVIAWWDYGYQITGIAKRTTLADGNTWNHEHIATIGRTLTSPEKKAWNVIRHLADYLLVWAGGGSDDLAKSPHLARIGNSVFPDHCGDDDPRCTKFGFGPDGTPTKMMNQSLLYKAVMHNLKPHVSLDPRYFKEVHTTKHGRMRVYQVVNISQESKQWLADPKNRLCDAPGSWYCVGQYPPALDKLIALRRNFAQLEDFNRKGQKSAYTRLVEQERDGVGAAGPKKHRAEI